MHFTKLFDYSVPRVAAATICVVGALAIAFYVGNVAYSIKLAQDTIEVTGSAREAVVADEARWVINLETKTGVVDQQSGFNRLDKGVEKIIAHLTEQGFTEFETPAGNSNPNYNYPQYGEPIMTGYTVACQVIVRSSDVEKLSTLANNIEPLTGEGYNLSTGSLELTYSKLAEMRIKLLTQAIKDAEERARAIAQDSGRKVDTLRNASSGVVQVLPEGGIEVSDYGSYDTQSMHKEVMVTVRATFSIK